MGLGLSLSISTSATKSIPIFLDILDTYRPILNQQVAYIQQRCRDLQNPLRFINAKHSYLVAVTHSGRLIRYDYTQDSNKPIITYDYWEFLPSDFYRSSKVIPGYTVQNVNECVRKHSSKDYSLIQHNCQHFCRDVFNQLTGQSRISLRNDFLRWLKQSLPPNDRQEFQNQQQLGIFLGDTVEKDINKLMKSGFTAGEVMKRIANYFLKINRSSIPQQNKHLFQQSTSHKQMVGSQNETKLSLGPTAICSGIGGSIAQFLTLPFDTIKVRMMLYPGKYTSMLDCATKIVGESPTKLWAGLVPGIHRQLVYCSIRVSLFYSLSERLAKSSPTGQPQSTSLLQKIGLGLFTGGLAISIANPTEVVKIRIQGDMKSVGQAPRYKGAIDAYGQILSKEGLSAFWTGVGPNVVRNSVINAAELTTYAQLKEFILGRKLMEDNLPCHFTCGYLAGVAAVICGNPVDMIKNRIINAKQGEYTGIMDCISKTAKEGGLGVFYKGFWPNVLRIGTWNMFMFVAFESCKKKWKATFGDSK